MPTNYDLTLGLSTGAAAADVARLGNAAAKTGGQFGAAQSKISGAATSTTRYSGAATKATRSSATAAKSTAAFGGATKQAGFNLAKTLKFALATAAAYLSISAAAFQMTRTIGVFAQFEKSMAAVQAVTTASDDAFGLMTMSARMLGETTIFSASQAAAGMEFLGRASFSATEIVSAMPSVLALATAAQLDLGASADITSNIMSAFGVAASEATRIADSLAVAASSANTDVAQMGEAMKFVGPVAAALGVSMEDTAAFIGILGNAGIQASMAGTGLRRILSELVSPTDKAREVIRGLGLDMAELNPETESLVNIVARLADAGLGAAGALEIFGDRGAPAILAATSQVSELRELTAAVNDSGGAAQGMADVMQDTLSGAGKELASVVESLRIAFGEQLEPVLRSSAEALKAFLVDQAPNVEAFGRIMASTLSAAGSGALLLADNVDILVGSFQVFLVLKIPAAITAISTAWSALTVIILANPVGAALVAIGLALAAVNVAVTQLKRKWQTEINAMVKDADRLADAMLDFQDVIRTGNQDRLNQQLAKTRGEMESLREEAARLGKAKDAEFFAEGASERFGELSTAIDDVTRVLLRHEVEELKTVAALERLDSATKGAEGGLGDLGDAAGDSAGDIVKVSDALQELRSEVVNQRSLATAMTAFGLSAESAEIAVGTLIAAEMEAGASAFEAANAVADMLGQEDNAAVLRVIELVKELREVADLQDRRLATIREIARLEGQGGLPDVRPVGPIALPPGRGQSNFGGFFGGIPSGPDVDRILAKEAAEKAGQIWIDAAHRFAGIVEGSAGFWIDGVASAMANFGELVKAGAGGLGGLIQAFAPLISQLIGGKGPQQIGRLGGVGSGDRSQEGQAVGQLIGSFFGPVGGAIGGLLGQAAGKAIKLKAEEAIAEFSTIGDELFVKILADPEGLDQATRDIARAIKGRLEGFADSIGAAFSLGSEGFRLQITGDDRIKVIFGNIEKEFSDAGAAIDFAVAQAIRKGLFTGVGPNVQAALAGLSGQRGGPSVVLESLPTQEEIDELFSLARALDDFESGIGPTGKALEQLAVDQKNAVAVAVRFGLDVGKVFDLMDSEIQTTLDSIEGRVAGLLGVQDAFGSAFDLLQDFQDVNNAIVEAEEDRLDRMEELAKRAVGLAEGRPLGGAGSGVTAGDVPLRGGPTLGTVAAGENSLQELAESMFGGVQDFGNTLGEAGEIFGGVVADASEGIGSNLHEMGEGIIGEVEDLGGQLEGVTPVFPPGIFGTVDQFGDDMKLLDELFKSGQITATEYEKQVGILESQMKEATSQLGDLNAEMDALAAREIPDVLDVDLIRQAFGAAALAAGDNLSGLFSTLRGFTASQGALEALRHEVTMDRLRAELIQLELNLAASDNLSAAAIAAGNELRQNIINALGGLEAGTITVGRPGGRGGGKRAEAAREAEAAADAQVRASEAFSDAMATLGDQTSGATDSTLAWNRRVQDFRDLAMEAGAGTEAVVEGLRLMAEIDLRALGDAWETTAAQFRGSDLEGAVRDVGQRRQAAIDAANEREEFAPDAAAEAKKQIREGTRRQFAELGKAALDGFRGPMRQLTQDGKESVKTIEFLAANLGKLDITASQLAKTVKDAVLGPFLALAESEAIRVGDTQAASDIADRRMKIEKAFQVAQLRVWEAMLRAADAFTKFLGELFADTERRLGQPDAPGGPPSGETDRERRARQARERSRRLAGRRGTTTAAPRVLDVDALLGPFENLGLSALERELLGINSQFVDIRDTFQDIGATAPQWARLEAAQAGAIEAFWQRATDPLRDLLGELLRNDPRVTTEGAFLSARDQFSDLAARARGGDLGALEQLAGAGRNLLDASAAFKGEGVGSLAVRDEVISALEDLTGGAAFADPVVSEVREGNLILSEMRDILRATQGGVPRAARDRARALPPSAAASQSGSFVRSGTVGQQVVRLAARVDRQEGRGREDMRLLIAAFRARDRKEDRRHTTERTQDRAAEVAVAKQRERLIAAVLAGNLQEAEILAEALANRPPSTGVSG